jgi:hypothetical protein
MAAGPNSGAIRRSLVDASSAATMFLAPRALASLSSSDPYVSKKLTTLGF